MGWVKGNEIAGTTGKGLKMEAIKIKSSNCPQKIEYNVHISDVGWMGWVSDGEIGGTVGQVKSIEAIKIRFVK